MNLPADKYQWRNFDEESPAPAPRTATGAGAGFAPMMALTGGGQGFSPMPQGGPREAATAPDHGESIRAAQEAKDQAERLFQEERAALTRSAHELRLLNAALTEKMRQQEALGGRIAHELLGRLLDAAKKGAIKAAPEAWRQAFAAIARAAQLKGPLVIKAHPSQLAEIEQAMSQDGMPGQTSFIGDEEVALGELHVGDGTQDWMATMEDLFAELSAALIEARP